MKRTHESELAFSTVVVFFVKSKECHNWSWFGPYLAKLFRFRDLEVWRRFVPAGILSILFLQSTAWRTPAWKRRWSTKDIQPFWSYSSRSVFVGLCRGLVWEYRKHLQISLPCVAYPSNFLRLICRWHWLYFSFALGLCSIFLSLFSIFSFHGFISVLLPFSLFTTLQVQMCPLALDELVWYIFWRVDLVVRYSKPLPLAYIRKGIFCAAVLNDMIYGTAIEVMHCVLCRLWESCCSIYLIFPRLGRWFFKLCSGCQLFDWRCFWSRSRRHSVDWDII